MLPEDAAQPVGAATDAAVSLLADTLYGETRAGTTILNFKLIFLIKLSFASIHSGTFDR
jgi:hypothetical protein